MRTSTFSILVVCLIMGATSLTWGQSLSVSMSFPAFRSSFITGTDVNIQATTTTPANTTVTKVEFFLGTFTGPGNSKVIIKLGEDNTAPFSYTWTIPANQISYNELSLVVTNSTGATAVQGGSGYNRVDVYPPDYAASKKYYVQASASANNTAGTLAAPFNTIQKAADVVAPGDSVFVMAGTYTNISATGDVVTLRRTGTSTRWIVFTNYQSDVPKLSFNGWQGFQLNPCSAYIKIQGFEIVGNNANVTLPQATTQPGSCDNPTGTVSPIFNGNGISLSGRTGGNVRPHHVVLANNIVHDCGGGGISAIESDYVTIENNTVYNNAWYTIYGASGISLLNSWNYDANTASPRMIIRGNRSYGNRLFVKWRDGSVCKGITDGNGIILDNNNATFGANPIGAYTGKFLIENNLSYQNGGRGINVNYSDNATVINNTFYQNAVSPEISTEFAMRYAVSARFYNNIFYMRPDKPFGAPFNSLDLLFNNNLTFGGTGPPYFTGSQNIVGQDPQFADAPNANFQLTATSPAVNAGSSAPGQFSAKDILGIARPQGSGVDIGAYEFQGTPVLITQQPASGSAVCAGSSVSISVGVSGPVKAYQWYKNGSALTGVASATTATLTLPAVSVTDQGSYSVGITGFTSITSTAFSLTVNAVPDAPSLVTASDQPYPAGVSSLTISQNVGAVLLVGAGCSGGSLSLNGSNITPLAVITTQTGTQTYTATCTQNGCTSPAASFQLMVVPTTLSILHRDADYGNTGNNSIKPFLELANVGDQSIPYGEITVRYWLTSEGNAPPTNFAVYYAPLGTVQVKYVPLNQPRQGAFGYIEYSFPGEGSLLMGGNSGPIENGIQKTDGSNFNEADDYSYQANYADYVSNAHITAYRKGSDGTAVIVWGQEPTMVPAQTAVQVYSAAKDGPTTSQIQTRVELRNTGNVALPLAGLKLRYYFTSDNDQLANVYVDYADIGATNVQAQVVRVSPTMNGADSYVELSFPTSSLLLNPLSSLGAIDFRIVRSDYGFLNQSNDYSYTPNYGNVDLNPHITAYLNNNLLFGAPPSSASARVASEPGSGLSVRVMGNPVVGNRAEVEIQGVEGQAVAIQVVDLQGRMVQEQRVEQAGLREQISLPIDRSTGRVLLLQVSTQHESQTLKLVKP